MIVIVQLSPNTYCIGLHLTVVDSAPGVLRASMDQQSSTTHVQSTVRLPND